MTSPIASIGAIVEQGTDNTPAQLSASAQLFAKLTDGTRLCVMHSTIGVGMPREGVAAIWKPYTGPPLPDDPLEQERVLANYHVTRRDIEDAINQLLGRDPEQHRPPRLSWEPLIGLLASHGITVTDDDLIALPFAFEFSKQLLAELRS